MSDSAARVNPIRHITVFDPAVFGQRRVDVIGAGATGSKVLLGLARLGIANIHAWDFDKVESHNVANQSFSVNDVGEFKVDAVAKLAKHVTNTSIVPHNETVDGSQKLGDVVFLLTDTMSSRKAIWNGSIKMKLATKVMVETRMGVDQGRVYILNPCLPNHVEQWEATLCEDGKAQVSACGAAIAVGPTSDVLAGMAIWQFMRWFSTTQGADDPPENEVIFALRPPMLISRKFKG